MPLPTLISWTRRDENEMYTKIKLVCVYACIYLQQYVTARCMFTQYMFTCGDQKIPSGHIPEVCFIFFQLGSLVGLELAMKSRLDGSQDPGISYLSHPSTVLGWQGLITTLAFCLLVFLRQVRLHLLIIFIQKFHTCTQFILIISNIHSSPTPHGIFQREYPYQLCVLFCILPSDFDYLCSYRNRLFCNMNFGIEPRSSCS